MHARLTTIILIFLLALPASAVELRIATFNVDATPPIGSALCGASVPPMQGVADPLSARGIILLASDHDPIVLCAVDWTGIANESHTAWRQALADAAGTSIDRVMVHALHQHDAPFCDFATEALMAAHGMPGRMFDVDFSREMIDRVANAAKASLHDTVAITHIGMGKVMVEKIASNRRILGPDGKVAHVRWTACTDPALRAEPEGTIDPWMRAVSFWDGDKPLVILTHYATHPQSFYQTGMVSTDFPGIARAQREADLPDTVHIHFNGAAGNIGAGKYNDGNPANRPVLAARMHEGMQRAFDATQKHALADLELEWDVEQVRLPVRTEIDLEQERTQLADDSIDGSQRMRAAREIAWIECHETTPITIGRLRIGSLQMVYMPGELFVEYQLAAQAMAPDDFVCMAAYGDYGPGYIGTEESYPQGGYETGVYTSRTDPSVEDVLMNTLRALLVE